MRIAIDARDLATTTTGVGRYLTNLLYHFPDLRPEFEFYLYSDKEISPPVQRANLQYCPLKAHRWLWKQISMPIEQNRANLDVFFVPSYSASIWGRAKSVVTIHDLIYTRYPKWTNRSERWRFATVVLFTARFADRIIAVSEATRNDILAFTNVSPHKVDVVYEGVDAQFRPLPIESLDNARERLKLERPFILYVGTFHYRRNIPRLLQAFAYLKKGKKIPHQLVLSGLSNYRGSALEHWVKQQNLEQEVRYLGYASDEDLVALYNLAEVFVYPSMYEGFGLPVLEAMACGTPVVTCNVSALPEVAGNAALLVDPFDTQDLANAIAKILTQPFLKEELVGRGTEQSRKFSWRKAAEETLDLFARAVV